MKKTSQKPFLHIFRLLLIIVAFPFALAGILVWAAVLLGRAVANTVGKKRAIKT